MDLLYFKEIDSFPLNPYHLTTENFSFTLIPSSDTS